MKNGSFVLLTSITPLDFNSSKSQSCDYCLPSLSGYKTVWSLGLLRFIKTFFKEWSKTVVAESLVS